jgi:hypothetical protein
MFMIENYLATSHSNSWVLDTRCDFHICNNDQELKRGRRLLKGEVDLRMGNVARVAALDLGTYNLTLPSEMLLELDNCYFVLTLARNIVSISYLDLNLLSRTNVVLSIIIMFIMNQVIIQMVCMYLI